MCAWSLTMMSKCGVGAGIHLYISQLVKKVFFRPMRSLNHLPSWFKECPHSFAMCCSCITWYTKIIFIFWHDCMLFILSKAACRYKTLRETLNTKWDQIRNCHAQHFWLSLLDRDILVLQLLTGTDQQVLVHKGIYKSFSNQGVLALQ